MSGSEAVDKIDRRAACHMLWVTVWTLGTGLAIASQALAAETGPRPTNKPAKLSLEQLRDCLSRFYAQLHALDVEYEVLDSPDSEPHRVRYAFKGDKRYTARTGPGQEEPEFVGGIVNGTYWYLQPEQLTAGIVPVEQAGDALHYDAFVDALHIALADEAKSEAYLRPRFLPLALDAPTAQWKVRPKLEEVDGHLCHVLEGKALTLWVDTELGCAPRYAELYTEVDGTRRLVGSYHYADLADAGSGVYLPRLVEITAYSVSGKESRPSRRQTLKVLRIAVGDDVHDDLFEPAFPRGTTVLDATKGERYIAGPADAGVTRLTEQARDALTRPGARGPVGPRPTTWIVLGAGVAVVAIGLLALWIRSRAGARGGS